MKLYEFGPTRSLRVRWALEEMGVPFESVVVNLANGEHHRPEFLRVNPAAKIPVLVDGPHVLNESAAIVLYLAEKYPDRGMLPADGAERGQAYRWLFFTVTELEQPLWRITRNTRLYSDAERVPGDVPIASREFKEMAAVLDEHMRGREYVAGSRVSVVDFVLAWTLDWANEHELLGECPALLAYMERMYARPHAPPRIAEAFARLAS
jgi:glutathione S-transferase